MRIRSSQRAAGALTGTSRFRSAGALFLLVSTAVLLASCGGDDTGGLEETQPSGEEAESAGPARAVSVADYTDNPNEFYGNRIELSGQVTELVGQNAFAIGGDEVVGGEQVIIVGAQQLDQIVEGDEVEVTTDQTVQATGTAREFNVPEVENMIDYELDDNLFTDFEGNPALVASSAEVQVAGGETTSQGTDVSLSNIVDQPAEFFGQSVTVSGPVARIIDPTSFVVVPEETFNQQQEQGDTLYDSPDELAQDGVLVTTAGGRSVNLTERQTVSITGQVQQFDQQTFENEYRGSYTGDVYAPFSERPAIVASQVQLSPGEGSTGGSTTGQ